MRWWLVLAFLLLLPSGHATSDWHYAGDTFKLDGVLYSVEGFSTDKVLLGVGSKSYMISLGECAQTPLAEYCYIKSAYPDDESHIKYQSGKQYYGYLISITTVTPKLEVTRTMAPSSPVIGAQIEVQATIKNTADVTVESISYTESPPQGLRIIAGPNGASDISYSSKSLSPGQSETFKYYLRPYDYVDGNLQPSVTYSYAGQQFNTTVKPLTLTVASPLLVTHTISSSVNLDETGVYTLNLSNADPDRQITAHVAVRLPRGLHENGIQGFTEAAGGTYTADLTLPPRKNVSMQLKFLGSVSGTFTMPVEITANMAGTTFTRQYNDSVTAKADTLAPSITLSSTRANYRPGDPLTISGVLKNTNTVTSFRSISGTLNAPGLFPPAEFRHESFSPQRTLTEAEEQITIPAVTESKSYLIIFSGDYTTPGGEVFSFNTTRSITVAPVKEIVGITRTIEPASPVPGGNVTVTVTARNLFNQYVTFSAHETYDPALTRVGGITYS
jgi:hypothetical protein